MRIKTNYHTHSIYCDGKNSLSEVIEAACSADIEELGFSGHSYTAFDEEVCMSVADTCEYKQEISRLKDKYAGSIKILCGIEQDYFSEADSSDYDYIIGSVHYTYKNGKYLAVDDTPEIFEKAVVSHYNGDAYAFAEDYFKLVGDVVHKTGADIIGHFDLISKFNEKKHYFDEAHPRYEKAVDDALAKLVPTGKLFEINTGAMSRGYKSVPYPSAAIIKKIAAAGGSFILSSDSHSAETIDYAFDEVMEWLKNIGVDENLVVRSLR